MVLILPHHQVHNLLILQILIDLFDDVLLSHRDLLLERSRTDVDCEGAFIEADLSCIIRDKVTECITPYLLDIIVIVLIRQSIIVFKYIAYKPL